MASRSYLTWSVPKLRAELATRGASVGGRKTDLIERLKAYDRNRDFQPPPLESVPAPVSVGWPVSGYQQLQKEHKVFLPKITKEQIDQYFVYRMAGDKQFTKDIKAVSKGNAMFQGNRVQACSVTVKDNSIYFTGIVGAAMKNKVSYNYKLKMDKSTGDTLNSDCECPAGKGPHGTCKHLAAVLLMLQHFTETGSVVIDKSCTENLQLFHKPKATYHGVPVDAESIPSRKRPSDESLEDPRPAKFRKVPGYQDYVRSLLINYCSMTSEDIALRYLFGMANIQVAAVDHYYTRIPVTEYWVDEANKITEADVVRIEKETRQQASSKLWFHHRSWRLTASRFGEICKLTSRRNITKLCQNLMSVNNAMQNSALAHGKNYESKALKSFESRYSCKTRPVGLCISRSKPFLGATPDALLYDDCLVEVKCPYSGRNEKILPGKHFRFLDYNEKNEIILKRTSNYYYQVQGQLHICQKKSCYFVVYTFSDLFVEKINYDEEYCTGSLIPKLETFYIKFFRPFIASTL